jgi:hypothetical protein
MNLLKGWWKIVMFVGSMRQGDFWINLMGKGHRNWGSKKEGLMPTLMAG